MCLCIQYYSMMCRRDNEVGGSRWTQVDKSHPKSPPLMRCKLVAKLTLMAVQAVPTIHSVHYSGTVELC